jgi:hypothetical protein
MEVSSGGGGGGSGSAPSRPARSFSAGSTGSNGSLLNWITDEMDDTGGFYLGDGADREHYAPGTLDTTPLETLWQSITPRDRSSSS